MLADGVRVVVVMPFPGVVVVMEDEVAGEEEDFGAYLTALAHPFPMEANGQVSLGGQDGRVVFIGPVNDAAGYARMVVILGVLQGRLVTGWPVEHPLGSVSVDVAQEELLYQVVQAMVGILLLHTDELQLMHGKVHSLGALVTTLLLPQVIGYVLYPGTTRSQEAWASLVHQSTELFSNCFCVADDLDAMKLVVSLSAPTDDPGCLTKADLASDDESISGICTAVAAIIKLVGLEGIIVVESVRPGDELWARPHFTACGHPVALDGWGHLHRDPCAIVEMLEHMMAL